MINCYSQEVLQVQEDIFIYFLSFNIAPRWLQQMFYLFIYHYWAGSTADMLKKKEKNTIIKTNLAT